MSRGKRQGEALCALLFSLWACGTLHHADTATSGSRPIRASRHAALSGLGFDDRLVFVSTNTPSAVSCACLCVTSSPACVTFTYSASRRTCRGHRGVMTSLSPSFGSPGSEGFLVDWHGRDCSSAAECSVQNSECYAGHCLCTPGYFYSSGGKNCIEECSPADRQDTMVRYPDYDVYGTDIITEVTAALSMEQCRRLCVTDDRCAVLVYRRSRRECYTKYGTALLVPSQSRRVDPGETLDQYQRTCA